MGKKVRVFDLKNCNGCYCCQIACKEEHCSVDWLPFAKGQPDTGQFWMNIKEYERGSVPKVIVSYVPTTCNHCAKCALVEQFPDVVYRREDGHVIIDPERASGVEGIAEACPHGAVYYNEELKLAQKCTGCVHLLDDGWTEPRCVEACAMEALLWVDEDEVVEKYPNAVVLNAEVGTEPRVYYIDLPKRFVAGEVYDEVADEVLIGAKVTLLSPDGTELVTETDDFGDFWFKQVEALSYTLKIEYPGMMPRVLDADATERDAHVGAIALYKDAYAG